MHIELRNLRHLIAVAEHRNFSRAADALHLTQPALSRSIQALEAEVGAPVLVRTRGAIEPTEMGRLLLRHAQQLDASHRDLAREVALAKGLEAGELRIGVGPYGGSALVGPVVGRLNRQHPGLRITLRVAPWNEWPERARARDVDLILAAQDDVERLDDFETRALSDHPCHFVCRADHPLARRGSLSAQEALAYPLVGPALPDPALRALADAMPPVRRSALHGLSPLTVECDSSPILRDILLESDALSMMPRFMVEPELARGELVLLPAADLPLRVRFGTAWLRQRSLWHAELHFIELLTQHDAQLVRAA